MIKKLIIFFILSCFTISYSEARYNMSVPVEGASIANESLQFEVIKKIYKVISPQNSYCTDYSVTNTQIIHYPYDVKKKNNKYISGYWKELWTINQCENLTQIPVTFYIKKNNTTFHIDKFLIEK